MFCSTASSAVDAIARASSLSPGQDSLFVAFYLIQPGRADGNALLLAVVVPDRAEGEGLQLFKEREAGGVAPFGFQRAQAGRRLQQREEERLDHAARADDPGRHPVDAGVEEVQTDVNALQEVAAYQLLA